MLDEVALSAATIVQGQRGRRRRRPAAQRRIPSEVSSKTMLPLRGSATVVAMVAALCVSRLFAFEATDSCLRTIALAPHLCVPSNDEGRRGGWEELFDRFEDRGLTGARTAIPAAGACGRWTSWPGRAAPRGARLPPRMVQRSRRTSYPRAPTQALGSSLSDDEPPGAIIPPG